MCDAVICKYCNCTLLTLWQFRDMCMQNQSKLDKYLKGLDYPRKFRQADLFHVKNLEENRFVEESKGLPLIPESYVIVENDALTCVDHLCDVNETIKFKQEIEFDVIQSQDVKVNFILEENMSVQKTEELELKSIISYSDSEIQQEITCSVAVEEDIVKEECEISFNEELMMDVKKEHEEEEDIGLEENVKECYDSEGM